MARIPSSPDSKDNPRYFKIHKSNIEQFVQTYRLFYDQKQQSEIQECLREKFPKPKNKPVSLRTISEWLLQIRKSQMTISQKEREESEEVDWHKLDEYDLPWEASRSVANFRNRYKRMPNLRVLKWWWRLNQLGCWDPDKLCEWAGYYEGHDIKVMFGLETESLRELDDRMFKEMENQPGECKDK